MHVLPERIRNRRRPKWRSATLSLVALACVAVAVSALTGIAWSAGGSPPLAPLSSEAVPEPPNLADFVVDRSAAIALGKAFFWDMQAGSDGNTACATCHFNAGADSRSKNQVNPKGAPFFDGGANGQLSLADFPTHKLADPDNAASQVLSDTANVVASQSIASTAFVKVVPGNAVELGTPTPDKVFSVGGNNVRQVTPRNAPTVINATFNHREQWDGKARNTFNGVNPIGERSGATVLEATTPDSIAATKIALSDAPLASQAVGPMTNAGIMSFKGRTWKDIAIKLTSLRPLGEQAVSPSDSVLGPFADPSGKGLNVSYADLIERAFAPKWWSSNLVIKDPGANQTFVPRPAGALPANEISLLQANFSLFWGLAVDLYESSLVSDQTPVDQFLAGDQGALTKQEQDGMGIFTGKGQCSNCHSGAELTSDASSNVKANPLTDGVDTGFENIGVRPNSEDIGLGGDDGTPAKNPLADAPGPAAAGMFKVPSLRNVALTAPYFHNGSAGTLRQVVEFYNRGGNFGTDTNPSKAGEIKPLSLSEQDKQDLIAFLEALTDPRVLLQQAPFDHPELLIPNGAAGDTSSVQTSAPGVAADEYLELPAVGAGGATSIQPFPNNPFVPGFLQQLPAGSFQPVTAPVTPAAPDPANPAAPATPAAPAAPAAPPTAAQPQQPATTATTVAATPAKVARTRAVTTVTTKLVVKKAGRIRVRALDPKRKQQLVLLAGSRLGSAVSRRDALTISTRVAHAGKVALRLRIAQSQLPRNGKFRILIDTMGRRGAVATARLDVATK